MPIQTKLGVNLRIVPQLLAALQQIEHIFAQHGYVPVITSANDGAHAVGSLHYKGAAVDIRSKGLPSNVKSAIDASMRGAFPLPPWYLKLEFLNQDKEHWHLQHGLAIYDNLKQKIIGYSNLPGQ